MYQLPNYAKFVGPSYAEPISNMDDETDANILQNWDKVKVWSDRFKFGNAFCPAR